MRENEERNKEKVAAIVVAPVGVLVVLQLDVCVVEVHVDVADQDPFPSAGM